MVAHLGYISVKRHSEIGYIGGYLVVNSHARPLEFYCTMPVKPSRAQQLLYGPTVDEFVCGEQIAKALTTKGKIKPNVLLVDSLATLAISHVCELPVLHMEIGDSSESSLSIPSTTTLKHQSLTVGQMSLKVLSSRSYVNEQSIAHLESMAEAFDLAEPFDRIREALLEAHPIARAA
ncbi:MAG: hypothetical protein KDB03_12730 [Planctomycetales bacterium]|nr:hypothetical protein [Planctomycetales bacterium]